jgi:hypothetical protein
LANAVAPISQSGGNVDPNVIMKHEEISQTVPLFSPMTLYSEATNTILDPTRKTTRSIILMGPLERLSLSRFQSPLPLLQCIIIVIPHLISIVPACESGIGRVRSPGKKAEYTTAMIWRLLMVAEKGARILKGSLLLGEYMLEITLSMG